MLVVFPSCSDSDRFCIKVIKKKKKKQQLARAVSISLPKTVSKREHQVQAFLFIFNISKQIWTFAYSLWLCLDVVLMKQQRRSSRKGPETNWISTWISHNPPAHANAPIALETYPNLNFFLCLLVLSFALESLAACCYTAKQKKIFNKKKKVLA